MFPHLGFYKNVFTGNMKAQTLKPMKTNKICLIATGALLLVLLTSGTLRQRTTNNVIPATQLSCDTIEAEEEEIISVIQEPPKYPGGMRALMRYLRDNISYPQEYIEKNIEIAEEYCVNFVIDSTGVVTDVETVKSTGHTTLDKEIEKIVRGMEKWTPEKSFQIEKGDTTHRRTYRTKFSLPVHFKDKKAIINGINIIQMGHWKVIGWKQE